MHVSVSVLQCTCHARPVASEPKIDAIWAGHRIWQRSTHSWTVSHNRGAEPGADPWRRVSLAPARVPGTARSLGTFRAQPSRKVCQGQDLPCAGTPDAKSPIMDLIYVGLIVVFFALTWGLAVLGDHLAVARSNSKTENVR